MPNRPVLTTLAGLCGSVIFGVLAVSAFEAVTRALAGERWLEAVAFGVGLAVVGLLLLGGVRTLARGARRL